MELETFKKLKKITNERLLWTEETILETEKNLSKFYQEYQDVFSTEKLEHLDLITEKERIYGVLYEKFKYNDNKEWDSKAEIESQIKKQKEYTDICIKINRQQVIVEYLENTLKNITNISYNVREFIKWKMFLAGNSY